MKEILMPLAFKQIFETDKNYIWADGGRLGGKTNNFAKVAILMQLQSPNTDIIVARVSYGSLGDSSYAEIEAQIQDMELDNEYELKKSPLRIVRRNDAGTIYFLGYGGSNQSRTKSIKTKHKIKTVILEETQELKEKQNLDQALASFRRHFGENVKVCILGNPPPQEAHWFNVERKRVENDPDWLVVRLTWMDIVPFINDYDLKEILKTKINDPNYYEWFYMGETTGGFGSVYPMFRKEKHVITAQQYEIARERAGLKPVACIIGGDGAVNRDATAFVAWIILSNGQAVAGPIFYHNPKDDGVLGYHQLVQDHLTRWFDEICARFRLGTRQEVMMHPNMQVVPIWMRIDNAAPDLIQECKFFLGNRASIGPIKKLHVPQMVATVQSAICNENLIVVDYGGYYSYVKNQFIKKDMNVLAEQWSNLIWNEKQDNYDPIVPNDVSDAATYAVLFWYGNQENIQYFNILKMKNLQVKKIRDILNGKE